MLFNTISVIGLGYIGLPTAAMFASKEKKVIGVDINKHAVNTINAGKTHIVEPGLNEMVKEAVCGDFLRATITPEPAEAFLISVPTPFFPVKTKNSLPEPDLSFIKAAAESISKVLKKGDLVILESTSPVGATEQMADWLSQARPDLTFPQTHNDDSDVRVAYCPERVLPGHVISELVMNDRIIGGMSENCSKSAIELYKIFVKGDCVVTNSRTAEMAKLTENASRDVSIAFANELSIICDKLSIDVWELIELSNRHPRVNILKPGPGVGGHCIAVDPWFIASAAPEESQLITVGRRVNDAKPNWVFGKVKQAVANYLLTNPSKSAADVKIACYGLAFKANIDDLRESPALQIADKICGLPVQTLLIEPNISKLPKKYDENLLVDYGECDIDADIHVLLVDHDEFKKRQPKATIVIDTRGIWSD